MGSAMLNGILFSSPKTVHTPPKVKSEKKKKKKKQEKTEQKEKVKPYSPPPPPTKKLNTAMRFNNPHSVWR